MAYHGLKDFIRFLEKRGELVQIQTFVDPELEITEVTDRVSKNNQGGKALLFENTGTEFPILINAYGSLSRISSALGVKNLDALGDDIQSLLKSLMDSGGGIRGKLSKLPLLGRIASYMPSTRRGKGACQQVVMATPDLSLLPVLKCWPEDGGRFITLPMVHTKDPVTGIRNVGMYRMQVLDGQTTGMHWHLHKTGAKHYRGYKEANQLMPLAVTLGGDPAYAYSATAPLPENIDEYMLAGFIRKKKVRLVQCLTVDMQVPEDVDFVIEGYVDPSEELFMEGPFGDHTGYYSLPDLYPRFHVTCITHRSDAVYPATIVGIPPQEDVWIAKATERLFLSPLKFAIAPEIMDMNLPAAGVAHNLAIVSIKHEYKGQAQKVINALWGAGQMMFNKVAIIVGEEINVHDYREVFAAVTSKVLPSRDIFISKGPLDVLDHAAPETGFGGKLGIDATGVELLPDEQTPIVSHLIERLMLDEQVYSISTELMRDGYALVVLSFMTGVEDQAKMGILKRLSLSGARFMLVMDKEVDLSNLEMVAWLCLGNMDPSRDCHILQFAQDGNDYSSLVVDGCRKITGESGFSRDWPNVIVSSQDTIASVDQKWDSLQLGTKIPSPSLSYVRLVKNGGASIDEP